MVGMKFDLIIGDKGNLVAATITGEPGKSPANRAGRSKVTIDVSISSIVDEYFRLRGYANPDANQALLFLVSKIGELADAFVHGQQSWVRNNGKERNIAEEIADVFMMLAIFAKEMEIDLLDVLGDKLASKGYPRSWIPYFLIMVPTDESYQEEKLAGVRPPCLQTEDGCTGK
jgi:NTP pyrophosphatase (non-canonical NTP hydrolase)